MIRHDLKQEVEDFALSPQHDEILLSREKLHSFLLSSQNSKRMTTHQFRRFFYSANSSYYQQGALTYGASISLLGSERYSILGQNIFSSPSGILIAYDPEVVLGIFEAVGIPRHVIANLSIEDLIIIRKTFAFCAFRDAYYSFALALQELAIEAKRLSQNTILDIKSQIHIEAISRVFLEEKGYSKNQRLWNIGEMAFFTTALGVTGFFVIPLIGALLGAVPIVVYGLRLTPRLSDLVITKVLGKQLPFCIFIRELRELTERMRTNQIRAGVKH